MPARVHYKHRWGPNYQLGLGLPLDSFTSNQQKHIGAHRMCNLPTMMVQAERAQHRNVQMHEHCLLCGSSPETAQHVWACLV